MVVTLDAKTERPRTEEEIAEMWQCHPGGPLGGLRAFERFCAKHARIQCKLTHRYIPFELWDCQRDLAKLLITGRWVITLKARQLGLTTTVAAYSKWRATFHPLYTVCVINQGVSYAEEFISEKVKAVYDYLPEYMQLPLLKDTTRMLKFGSGGKGSHDSKISAFAGNENAARSATGNLVIFDEAARIDEFRECMKAAGPTLANTGGQVVVISTSKGPIGPFYEIFNDCYQKGRIERPVFFDGTELYETSKWTAVFFPWTAHPLRDEAWYAAEAEANKNDPDYMKQEFPATVEEAFEAAGDRIYPRFSRKTHLLHIPLEEFDRRWELYRAIDWGETSATVCLWIAVIPSETPRLTADPACEHFIDEMIGYRLDQATGKPVKKNDHAPDALRYGVTTFGLEEHWVHVYREFYISNPRAKGHTTRSLCAMIREHSGWVLVDPEKNEWKAGPDVECYTDTVYDRSKSILDNELSVFDIDAIQHTTPHGERMGKEEEVHQGIMDVNKLVVGALPYEMAVQKTPDDLEDELRNSRDPLGAYGIRTSGSLEAARRNRRKKRASKINGHGHHPVLGRTF